MTNLPSFPALLERFLTQRLMQQRRASPHTISSYRDTFRQFLKFAEERLHKPPSPFNFEEIDAPLVVAFLDSLDKHQGLSIRSRNLRLTAIHSFFRYTAFEVPAHSAQIQRVLAIPSKRFTRTLVEFLTRSEVDALLAAPDQHLRTALELADYLAALKKRGHRYLTIALRQLLRIVREYPRQSVVSAVADAARYGLFDLDRLERMVLRHIAREYFLLDEWKKGSPDEDE